MARRSQATGVAAVLLALGVVVGWLVLGEGEVTADDLDTIVAGAVIATAVGTLALAAATYYLAGQTGAVVEVARDEAHHARDALAAARDQAEIARAGLDAQTQPFLTVGDTSPAFLNAFTAHLRNAGNGAAVVTGVVFVSPDGELFSGGAKDPAVPPNEGTSVTLSAADENGRTTIGAADNFSVIVEFADVGGRRRGAARLDVYRRPTPPAPDAYQAQPRWWVRQVFWGGTLEEARHSPRLGTQPYE